MKSMLVLSKPTKSAASDPAVRRRSRFGPLGVYLPALIVLAVLVLLWYAVVSVFGIPGYIVPTPLQVWQALQASGWSYVPDIWTTTQEVLAGFALGVVAAVPLAFAIAMSPTLRRALYPLLILSQMVPIFALAVVVTIVFSYGLLPQIIVAALYSFFPIVVNGVDGLTSVDVELVNLLKSAGASRWAVFRLVRFPWALPSFFSGSKLAVVFAVSGAVIGEWIGGQSGLGYLMRFQNGSFAVPQMYATTIVLGLLGVTMFAVVSLLERVLLPWNRTQGEEIRR
jgi:ABC-type nitrate/sulfonate/bicarbonate transport system permease component